MHGSAAVMAKKHQEAAARGTRSVPCPTCGRPTLYGLDADLAASPARVDPTPIDRTAELAAIMLGLRTYSAWHTAGRIELTYRNSFNVTGDRRAPVHPQHRCGIEWPTTGTPTSRPNFERCPF